MSDKEAIKKLKRFLENDISPFAIIDDGGRLRCLTAEEAGNLAQAIIPYFKKEGYVKLEDVEIDKEEVTNKIADYAFCKKLFASDIFILAKIIAEARPIRIKED